MFEKAAGTLLSPVLSSSHTLRKVSPSQVVSCCISTRSSGFLTTSYACCLWSAGSSVDAGVVGVGSPIRVFLVQ